MTSWASFEGLGLKLIFLDMPCYWLIFIKSLFKSLTGDVISLSSEKREVSFVKSLAFEGNPVVISLI